MLGPAFFNAAKTNEFQKQTCFPENNKFWEPMGDAEGVAGMSLVARLKDVNFAEGHPHVTSLATCG